MPRGAGARRRTRDRARQRIIRRYQLDRCPAVLVFSGRAEGGYRLLGQVPAGSAAWAVLAGLGRMLDGALVLFSGAEARVRVSPVTLAAAGAHVAQSAVREYTPGAAWATGAAARTAREAAWLATQGELASDVGTMIGAAVRMAGAEMHRADPGWVPPEGWGEADGEEGLPVVHRPAPAGASVPGVTPSPARAQAEREWARPHEAPAEEVEAAREQLAAIDAERRRLEAVLRAQVAEEVRVQAEVDGERMVIAIGSGLAAEGGAVPASRDSPVGRAILAALASGRDEVVASAPGGPVRIRLLGPDPAGPIRAA